MNAGELDVLLPRLRGRRRPVLLLPHHIHLSRHTFGWLTPPPKVKKIYRGILEGIPDRVVRVHFIYQSHEYGHAILISFSIVAFNRYLQPSLLTIIAGQFHVYSCASIFSGNWSKGTVMV